MDENKWVKHEQINDNSQTVNKYTPLQYTRISIPPID